MQKYTHFNMAMLGLVLFGFLITGYIGIGLMEEYAKSHYGNSVYLPMVFSIIVPLIAGILLGIQSFINSKHKPTSWKINWPKLLYLGIPSLIFATFLLCYFLLGISFIPFTKYTAFLWEPTFYGTNAVILGYVIISSFYKEL